MTDGAALSTEQQQEPWRWIIGAFAVVLLLQLELVFNRPINWDEFFHLSEAYAFEQGHLTEVLQVLYARAFFWLPMLPLGAIDQIRVARLFMLGFELFTLCAIYGMARHFSGRLLAALATLAYLTGGYVFLHGFSYRADPMAAAFLMGSLWLLLSSRLDAKAILAAALLAALALLATIKVVFYAPAFAAIAWLRWREAEQPRDMLRRLLMLAAAAGVLGLLLIGATVYSLPNIPQAADGGAVKTIANSGTMMFDEGLFPRPHYIFGAMAAAPFLAGLVFAAPMAVVQAPMSRTSRIAIASLMLPLASILLYRNAFPYFYAFILPPVMVGVAFAIGQVLDRVSVRTLLIALVANALAISFVTPRAILTTQQQVLAAVHEIFPEPVAYFDFPGMIPDFPKANFFMSTWGMRRYWVGREERFVDVMAREPVPLLILNEEVLERNQLAGKPARELDAADAKALREGFVPHWGPLWVAGRRFPIDHAEGDFYIYTPGVYTVEGAASVRIDGRHYRSGDILTLGRGNHRFERLADGEAGLRWGRHLKRPARPFDGNRLFKDF